MPLISRSKWLYSLTPLAMTLAMSCANGEPPLETSKPRSLFNGIDLKGWTVDGTVTTVNNRPERPVWSVRDGTIRCAGEGFGFLRYDEKFKDFKLSLEYRLQRGTNSGVGIRTVIYEDGNKQTRPSRAGYEIQTADDGTTTPSIHGTGSIYRHMAPKSLPANPAGEWNRLVIDCQGPCLRVWLNDKVIQDFDQRTLRSTRDKPLEGFIALQNHGGEVDFRDIRIEEQE